VCWSQCLLSHSTRTILKPSNPSSRARPAWETLCVASIRTHSMSDVCITCSSHDLCVLRLPHQVHPGLKRLLYGLVNCRFKRITCCSLVDKLGLVLELDGLVGGWVPHLATWLVHVHRVLGCTVVAVVECSRVCGSTQLFRSYRRWCGSYFTQFTFKGFTKGAFQYFV